MVMFREHQEVQITYACTDRCLQNKHGTVKMIESDGSAWVQVSPLIKETSVRHHKMRGQCVLLFPDECEPA